MQYYLDLMSPLGPMTAVQEDGALVLLDFGLHQPAGAQRKETDLLKETKKQIAEYFGGSRRLFSLPLKPMGSEFQLKVWQALQTIPYGETRSYRDIALQVGSPKGMRAVGGANHRNAISIVIPCHRVIGADGSLTGYGGGLDKKEALLKLEQENSQA